MTPQLLHLNAALHSESSGIELSIVVPALNEELTIEEFIDWCHEGLGKARVSGEVLIVDSSSDATEAKALERGARVLKLERRGLGRAYRDAIPAIRGRYVLMGDADCTYDFRELRPFLEKFRAGYEYVMGSRFRGSIEPGSMPWLHRYLGTPVTTWILNLLYASRFSDIHCGMRGITREALVRMDLQSDSWEYASEMVLKSVQMKLKTAEVPVRFLKDREGRISQHKRSGWLSPWKAAWINLRAMLVHGAEFFALRPGIAMFAAGLALVLPLAAGPRTVGPVTLSLYSMLFGVTLAVAGLQSFYLGCVSQIVHDYTGTARRRWLRMFSYNRSVAVSGVLLVSGAGMLVPLFRDYAAHGLSLPGLPGAAHHIAIAGLLALILGFMNFVFTLVLHAVALHAPPLASPAQVVATTPVVIVEESAVAVL